MEPSNWASEHSDALRKYFALGLSFSTIGRKINARFGTSYTRSAVLGRAKRMGLAAAPGLASPSIVPSLPEGTAAAQQQGAFSRHRIQPPATAFKPAEPVILRCVGVRPRLISVVDLEWGDCRYPYGGDKEGEPITFCGHPQHPGSSYCNAHFSLTRGPDTAPGRTAGPVVLRLVAAS